METECRSSLGRELVGVGGFLLAMALILSACGGGTSDEPGATASGAAGGGGSGGGGSSPITGSGTGLATGPGGTTGLDAGDCPDPAVLCVAGAGAAHAEYTDIQSAVNAASPGDVVLVFDGRYAGFRLDGGGTAAAPITVSAQGRAVHVEGNASGATAGIFICNASWVTVEGFIVERNGAAGFGIAARCATATAPMRGVVIRNNVVRDAGSTNIYVSQVRDSLIEGNVSSGSRSSHGLYVANGGSDDTIVRYNELYGNAKAGLHLNGDASVGAGTDGLHTGIVIEGNVIHRNGGNGIDADGLHDSSIVNNVIYRNGNRGIRVHRTDASAGAGNLVIANNTVANNPGHAIKLTADSGGHRIFNNVMLGNGGHIVVENARFDSDHNVIDGSGTFSIDNEITLLDLNGWQALGHGRNTQRSRGRDVFVDEANDDYRPRAGALVIDAGVSSLGGATMPARDLEGNVRPRGSGPDMGAWER